ncbi:MAG: PAS domain S-box protein [Zetaproteobacteria bacterium]|nr:MAG: PAS domain S-box protein [Zetaproteobacteria bacterium]
MGHAVPGPGRSGLSPDTLRKRYLALLTDYSAGGDEALLHQAQQFGREMVAARVPPEQIADMHHCAMIALRERLPDHDCRTLLTTGSRILSEILMSYGLAFRESLSRSELEERLRLASEVVENTQDGVIVTDPNGVIIQVNPAFCTVTGYSAEEAIGKTPAILKSGRQDTAFYREMWRAIREEGRWSGKLWNRRKNGDIYPEHLSITTVYDRSGRPSHLVGVFSDISRQELLEEQLRQSSKMESIGTLVGGIAHDFNNMLAGLSGNLYLLANRIDKRDPCYNRIAQMEAICARAGEMIAQLLAFARKGVVEMQEIPFTSFLKEAVKLARVAIPENVCFRYTIPAEQLVVRGDATQLQQVVMNLLNNARDAVAGRERPEIEVVLACYEPDDDFRARHPHRVGEGAWFVHLTVRDNGIGIPAELLNQIFDPFFTTKEEGKGTGLGLSMVYGAVQSHGGIIEVESRSNLGTAFHIYLPLVGHDAGGECPAREAEAGAVGEARMAAAPLILLADDNPGVRASTAEVLEEMGYRVCTAADGEEAWALYRGRAGGYDLVLLDVVMPHIDGLRLAAMIREVAPDQPILFATGYDKERLFQGRDAALADIPVLSKPFRFDRLDRTIREVIAGRG